jgi:hypothetical protein
MIPVGVPDEQPFAEDKLDFLQIGKSTKEQISVTLSDYPVKTDDGELRLTLAPSEFHDGRVWVYAADWLSWELLVMTGYAYMGAAEVFKLNNSNILILNFDDREVLTDYEIINLQISSNDFAYPGICSDTGVCQWGHKILLFASEENDAKAKDFSAKGEQCFVYGINDSDRVLAVQLDNYSKVLLVNSELFAYWEIAPGQHRFTKHYIQATTWEERQVANWTTLLKESIDFECAPGERVFLRSYWRPSWWRYHIESSIEQITLEEAHEALSERHMIDSPLTREPQPPHN